MKGLDISQTKYFSMVISMFPFRNISEFLLCKIFGLFILIWNKKKFQGFGIFHGTEMLYSNQPKEQVHSGGRHPQSKQFSETHPPTFSSMVALHMKLTKASHINHADTEVISWDLTCDLQI